MKFVKLAVAASIVAAAGTAGAATQGDLGGTSTGTAEVIVVKDEAVQITNVDDFDFNDDGAGDSLVLSSLAADPTVTDDVCVFNSTAGYQVTVSSANGFVLNGPGTDTIGYDITWAGTDASAGTPILGNGDNADPTCGGTGNVEVAVTLSALDFNAAEPGTYSDTVTMLVAPQ